MRLADVLSEPLSIEFRQVESFLTSGRSDAGLHKPISVGTVVRWYWCPGCHAMRDHISGTKLVCVMVNDRRMSLDCVLTCHLCKSTIELWYLVEADGSLIGRDPYVRVARFTENLGPQASGSAGDKSAYAEFLALADAAHNLAFGAGAMVYLRQIFEVATRGVATAADVDLKRKDGRRKSFAQLLREVDEDHHIVPAEFSKDGYKLFSELSEVVHGSSGESVALERYVPCRRLVVGVVENIANTREFKAAIAELHWEASAVAQTVEGGPAV